MRVVEGDQTNRWYNKLIACELSLLCIAGVKHLAVLLFFAFVIILFHVTDVYYYSPLRQHC
jgi:hypothetical protein